MKQVGESLLYTFINVVGSFITIIFSLGMSVIFEDRLLRKEELFGKGEVIIICVPLCINVIYCLYHNKKDKGSYSWSSFVFWLTLILVIFSTWCYSKLTTEKLDFTENLVTFSSIIMIWTICSVFFSNFLDSQNVDLKKDRGRDLSDLTIKIKKFIK